MSRENVTKFATNFAGNLRVFLRNFSIIWLKKSRKKLIFTFKKALSRGFGAALNVVLYRAVSRRFIFLLVPHENQIAFSYIKFTNSQLWRWAWILSNFIDPDKSSILSVPKTQNFADNESSLFRFNFAGLIIAFLTCI